MTTWNAKGYSESPAAHFVQSLTTDELLILIKNITGKTYNIDHYPGNKKGGLIGSLNRIAIKHLQELTGQDQHAGPRYGRTSPKTPEALAKWLTGMDRQV